MSAPQQADGPNCPEDCKYCKDQGLKADVIKFLEQFPKKLGELCTKLAGAKVEMRGSHFSPAMSLNFLPCIEAITANCLIEHYKPVCAALLEVIRVLQKLKVSVNARLSDQSPIVVNIFATAALLGIFESEKIPEMWALFAPEQLTKLKPILSAQYNKIEHMIDTSLAPSSELFRYAGSVSVSFDKFRDGVIKNCFGMYLHLQAPPTV